MKLTDLKKIKENTDRVDELALNQVIGDYGAAAAKQLGNRLLGRGEGALSIKDKMAKTKFIQDFVGRASTALDSAVSSGLVDPDLGGPAPAAAPASPAAPTAPAASSPSTPASPAAPAAAAPAAAAPAKAGMGVGQKAAAAAMGQRQTNQNLNNYVQGAAKALNAATDKNQKIQLTKELVNFMADRKDYPEWGNAVSTVQQVIKKGNVDPNFANAAMAKLKAGQTMAESWQMYWINKLLEAVDLSWEDLGLTVLHESKNGTYAIVESKFQKLNTIFESIISEAEAESIQSWFKRWLNQYMKGVDLSDPKTAAQIDQYVDAIQQTYRKDKGKAALNQLANAAFSLSYSNKGTPGALGATAGKAAEPADTGSAGGPLARMAAKAGGPATSGATEPADATAASSPIARMAGASSASSAQNSNELITVAKDALQKLQKVDPAAYSAFVKELTSPKAPAASAAPSAPAAKPRTPFRAPTKAPVAKPTVTAESKKIKPFKKW